MPVDMKQIVALREKTGMGVADCKKALEDAGGDFDKAEMALRKKGIDKAAKKADRPTGQGVIAVKIKGNVAAIVELACEQEPTTTNTRFLHTLELVLDAALAAKVKSGEELLAAQTPEGTVQEAVKALAGVVGENVQLRKAATVEAPQGGAIGRYVHFNKKAAAVLAVRLEGADAANPALQTALNDICMHAVAARPLAMDRNGIPADVIAKEKEVFAEEVKGKPDAIREKILDGKLNKFYNERVLVEQLYVKDPEGKTLVSQVLEQAAKAAGGKAAIVEFARLELGL